MERASFRITEITKLIGPLEPREFSLSHSLERFKFLLIPSFWAFIRRQFQTFKIRMLVIYEINIGTDYAIFSIKTLEPNARGEEMLQLKGNNQMNF